MIKCTDLSGIRERFLLSPLTRVCTVFISIFKIYIAKVLILSDMDLQKKKKSGQIGVICPDVIFDRIRSGQRNFMNV